MLPSPKGIPRSFMAGQACDKSAVSLSGHRKRRSDCFHRAATVSLLHSGRARARGALQNEASDHRSAALGVYSKPRKRGDRLVSKGRRRESIFRIDETLRAPRVYVWVCEREVSWTLTLLPFDRPEFVDLLVLGKLLGEPQSGEKKGRIGDLPNSFHRERL